MKEKCKHIKKYLELRGYGRGARIKYYGMCFCGCNQGINNFYVVEGIIWDVDDPTLMFLDVGSKVDDFKGIPVYDIKNNKLNENIILVEPSTKDKVKFSQYDDNVVGVKYNEWHIGEVEIIAASTHITYYREPLLYLPKYYMDSSEVVRTMEETPENILRKFNLYVERYNFKVRLGIFEETYDLNIGIE